jgi:hypothetical protein
MTITLRATKGAPLTITELDGNFTDLDGRVQGLENTASTARSIDEITQSGNSLFIQYNDSTQDGPFTFDVRIEYRGDWAASTVYAVNDLVKSNGVIYIVAIAHTSGLTFDAGANNGSGGDYYIPFLEMPELQIPVGGDAGYVLAKASSDDNDVQWQARGLPDGGAAGYVLQKASSDDLDVEWAAASDAPGVTNISAATWTLALSDANTYMRFTSASGCIVTIPVYADVAFPVGTEVHLRQAGAGSIQLAVGAESAADITINPQRAGYGTYTTWQGATLTIKKVGTNEWDVIGPAGVEETTAGGFES